MLPMRPETGPFLSTMRKKFKILSIDGGGVRGLIPCKLLASLERRLQAEHGEDARLADYFDLICGTSTGSILAIGLSLGMSAEEMLNFYENRGTDIFPTDRQSWTRKFSNWMMTHSFYERYQLKKILKEVYGRFTPDGDTRLGHAHTRLIIPAYNGETGQLHLFRTAHAAHLPDAGQVPALAVALSSAAAPLFFRPYNFTYAPKGSTERIVFRKMIDGGIVANNPAFIGLCEAVRDLHIPLHNIALLSLGTGNVDYQLKPDLHQMAPHFWTSPISEEVMSLINSITAVQSKDAHEKVLMLQSGLENGGSPRFDYLRIQHRFSKEKFIELDDASRESVLRMLIIAHQLYEEHGEKIYHTFLREPATPFVPIYVP